MRGWRSLGFRNNNGSNHNEQVNIPEKLALFHDHWHPRIVGELNGLHVKLVKFQGELTREALEKI